MIIAASIAIGGIERGVWPHFERLQAERDRLRFDYERTFGNEGHPRGQIGCSMTGFFPGMVCVNNRSSDLRLFIWAHAEYIKTIEVIP